jgi:hypothetical protein
MEHLNYPLDTEEMKVALHSTVTKINELVDAFNAHSIYHSESTIDREDLETQLSEMMEQIVRLSARLDNQD